MGVLGKTRDEAIDKPGKSENLAPCSRNQREVKEAVTVVISLFRGLIQ